MSKNIYVNVNEDSLDDDSTTVDLFEDVENDEQNLGGQGDNSDELEASVIPDKFKGKSAEDIAKAYTELEREYGRQANEYGDLRKKTDEFLFDRMDSERSNRDDQLESVAADTAVTFDDIVEDPNTAVDKLVSSKLKPLTDKLEDFEKKERLQSFQSEFPEYQKDIADPDFQTWVEGSKYRTNLFVKANNYDNVAGSELWSEWYEVKARKSAEMQEARDEAENKQERNLKKASSETGSTGARTRQIYKRRDLINLKATDPEKYYANIEEYKLAYKEKRVK